MDRIAKYKVFALLLTLIFFVSNVGLPFVLASCPMMTKTQPHCPMCPDQSRSDSQVLTGEKNTSCCRTIIAAERNKTDFVESQGIRLHYAGICSIPPLLQTFNVGILPSFLRLSSESTSLRSGDIPIFTSSLLI